MFSTRKLNVSDKKSIFFAYFYFVSDSKKTVGIAGEVAKHSLHTNTIFTNFSIVKLVC